MSTVFSHLGDIVGTALNNEVNRATTAESSLQTQIDTLGTDKLDASEISKYIRSDADDTVSGILSFTSQVPQLRFIDTTASQADYAFYLNSNTFQILCDTNSDGNFNQDVIKFNGVTQEAYIFGTYSLWHTGNGGPGSGLDADRLDGLEAAAFARKDQSNTFTGNIAANQLQSEVATGTAPLSVQSTTLVSNLNADLLDGVEGANYARTDITETFDGSLVVAGALHTNDEAIEINIGGSGDRVAYVDFHSADSPPDYSARAIRYEGVDGGFLLENTGAGTLTLKTNGGNIQIDGGDLDCNSNQILKSSYVQIADASLGTGTHTFNYASGDMQQLTATGNITLAFSNFVSGSLCSMIIDAVNWGTYIITHPASMLFTDSTVPTYTSSGTDRLLVVKDKDDVYSLFVIGQNIGSV